MKKKEAAYGENLQAQWIFEQLLEAGRPFRNSTYFIVLLVFQSHLFNYKLDKLVFYMN